MRDGMLLRFWMKKQCFGEVARVDEGPGRWVGEAIDV